MSEFKKVINEEIIKIKKTLYGEELKSAFCAAIMSLSFCFAFIPPFTIWSVVAGFVGWHFLKKFRLTVKKQILHAQHIEFLKNSTGQKVWTPKD